MKEVGKRERPRDKGNFGMQMGTTTKVRFLLEISLGYWEKGKACGYGIYKHANGSTYKGYWKNDCQEGKGVEIWADNSHYDGEYFAGKKHGKGVYLWGDGTSYDGEWHENNMHGYGVYKLSLIHI